MQETEPPILRLLLAGVPAEDKERLQTFIRIRSDRLKHRWKVVTAAPVNVYVHVEDEAPTIPGPLDTEPSRIAIRSTASASDPEGAQLLRPLQFEAFTDRLVAYETSLAPGERSATASASLRSSLGTTSPSHEPARSLRFKLRRWPNLGVLQTHRYGVRMASFLSSRSMSIDELARLSGASREECDQFIAALLGADLLAVGNTEESSGRIPAPPTGATSDLAQAGRPSRSTLSSLRAKLGIQRS